MFKIQIYLENVYGVHGADAKFLAEEFFKNARVLRSWGQDKSKSAKKLKTEKVEDKSDSMEYVCIRAGLEFEQAIQFVLITRQLRAEVWSPKGTIWSLDKKVIFVPWVIKSRDLQEIWKILRNILTKKPWQILL